MLVKPSDVSDNQNRLHLQMIVSDTYHDTSTLCCDKSA